MSPKALFFESSRGEAFSLTFDPSPFLFCTVRCACLSYPNSCVLTRLHFIDLTIYGDAGTIYRLAPVVKRRFCKQHELCTPTEQGCQPLMPRNISHKSFNSSEQTISIMAKWNENVDSRKRPGAIRPQMSGSSTSLRRQHRWVTCLFMKSFYSWNKIGFAKPARIFGTWTEIISPIISGKLTLVGSDWACTNRSNVNWWSFFTVWKRSRRGHGDGRG